MTSRILLLLGLFGGLLFAQEDLDHVVILLDASGSMSDRMQGQVKLDAAKQAIGEVLRQVPAETRIGLLVFSERVPDPGWVVDLGVRDDAAFTRALQGVEAKGGTPLGRYMKRAADRLLEAREANLGYGTYRLLVVTDGEASDGDKVDLFAPQILGRNLLMDVIGVDMSRDHTLKRMASSYRRADDAASLQSAISEVLAEVSAADGGAVAYEEAFDLLSGIPDTMAMTMLQGITDTSNEPLSLDRRAAVGADSGSTAHPASPSGQRGFRIRPGWIFMAFVVLFVVLPALMRKGKR